MSLKGDYKKKPARPPVVKGGPYQAVCTRCGCNPERPCERCRTQVCSYCGEG